MMNLYQILRDSADLMPDRAYLYSRTTEAISYSEAVAKSAALAEALRSSDQFSQEPVLAAVMEGAEQLVNLIWACLAAGICLAFLPKNRHPGQTRLLMRQVGADALVSDVGSPCKTVQVSKNHLFKTGATMSSRHVRGQDVKPDIIAGVFCL